MRRVIKVGDVLWNLTAVEHISNLGSSKGALWKFRCDCGTKKEILAKEVVRGNSKTCGRPECPFHRELRHIKRKNKRDNSSLHSMFLRYMSGAARRGHEWSLTEDEFRYIVIQDCHYCGASPSSRQYSVYTIDVNGIDRVDNKRGYIKGNVMPCCTLCNMMKGKLGYSQFIEHTRQIYFYKIGGILREEIQGHANGGADSTTSNTQRGTRDRQSMDGSV